MARTLPAALLAAALLLGPAGAQDAGKEKKELDALRGEWKVERLDSDKEEVREFFEENGRVAIDGPRALLLGEAEKGKPIRFAAFALKLDVTRSPKEVDLTVEEAVSAQGLALKKGAILRGIYRLDGDLLRLFVTAPGEPRPKGFPGEEKPGMVVLKRLKVRR